MKLESLDSFYDSKNLSELLDENNKKIYNGCFGGFSVILSHVDWLRPSDYLDFKMSNSNKSLSYPIYDIMIVNKKHISKWIVDRMDESFKKIIKLTDFDDCTMFHLPSLNESLRKDKIYGFGRSYDPTYDCIAMFYNLEDK